MKINERERVVAQIANPYFDYSLGSIDSVKNLPIEFIDSNKISLLLKEKGIETEKAQEAMEHRKCLISELCELNYDFENSGIDFVLIKFSKLPKPPGDLDILIINGLEEAENVLKNKGYVYRLKDADPDRKTYYKTIDGKSVAVDLHLDTTWAGIKYLKKEDVWEHKGERKINGMSIPVPCPEHELLIAAAHGMRENRITLFDVLHIANIFRENEINMKFVMAVAKEYNWLNQINYFISLTDEIYRALYGSPITKNPILNLKFSNLKRLELKLPFSFPFHISFKLKLQKIISDLIHFGVGSAVHDLRSYYLDIPEFLRGVRR